MTRLLTPHIATMTELREPHKVLERSGGKPVAILKNSALVGYLATRILGVAVLASVFSANGGYVALMLAGARPSAVRGAVLCDGPGLWGGATLQSALAP